MSAERKEVSEEPQTYVVNDLVIWIVSDVHCSTNTNRWHHLRRAKRGAFLMKHERTKRAKRILSGIMLV